MMPDNPTIGFRMINQSLKCKGPRLLVFNVEPPAAVTASSFAGPNDAYITNGWVHLRVCNGTLMPSLAQQMPGAPEWLDKTDDRGTKRPREVAPPLSSSIISMSSTTSSPSAQEWDFVSTAVATSGASSAISLLASSFRGLSPTTTSLKDFFSAVQLASSTSERTLRMILRWCSQIAWAYDQTELMAWVLTQAAQLRLPLGDFAPMGMGVSLNAPGTPPPFVSEVLGWSGFGVGVAFADSFSWVANDQFDQHVCRRRTLLESDARLTCGAVAHFSPESEIQPFETEVIFPLIASLAPAPASDDDGEASGEASGEARGEALAFAADDLLAAGGLGKEGSAAAALQQPPACDLHSEIVDSTSLWRIFLRAIDAYVCCTIVFRCALLRDGTVWVVGSYEPLRAPDGSWVTERPCQAARLAQRCACA